VVHNVLEAVFIADDATAVWADLLSVNHEGHVGQSGIKVHPHARLLLPDD
jgi:hypothetical protein